VYSFSLAASKVFASSLLALVNTNGPASKNSDFYREIMT
jgi:hypothetical protein